MIQTWIVPLLYSFSLCPHPYSSPLVRVREYMYLRGCKDLPIVENKGYTKLMQGSEQEKPNNSKSLAGHRNRGKKTVAQKVDAYNWRS